MNRITTTLGALAMTATAAAAGGIDRSGQDIDIIFEKGSAVSMSFGRVNPSITSTNPAAAGDVGVGYNQFSLGYKQALSDTLDLAIILDQPFGANIAYTGGPLVGTRAKLESSAITGVLRYKLNNGISLLGGLRAHSLSGSAAVPLAGYTLETDTAIGFGYLVGVAYEKPEIALRASLTYHSKIDHTLAGTETSPIPGSPTTDFKNTTPQSVNLDVQSGIAKDTLLFGSIRWVDWSEYDVTPARYPLGALVDYKDDVFTYTLGVGRKFNDTWSGAISLADEKSTGKPSPNLGPTDGRKSVSLAAIYTMGSTKITTGISYVDIGDTTSDAGIAFSGSDAIGVGVSVVHTF